MIAGKLSTLVACATLGGSVMIFGAAAAAQDTTGVGSLSGSVVDATGAPAAFVTVCLAATTQCVMADERGAFRLLNIRPGEYALEVTPPGERALPVGRFDVRAGVDQRLEITLPARDRFETTVTVTAPSVAAPEEVKTSAYLVSSQEIFRAAGALQDVSRYVQTVPGVVIGSDDFRNDIIVRGGSPLENLFIVDNVEIPNINTFANFASAGGTVSILDPSMIRDVTFITGGYPASYTNRTSSVLQITQREGSRERVQARATLGFAGAGGAVEGPLAKGRGSWVFSARRSFLDLFTDDIGVGGVPVLYTVNAKAVYDLSARDRIWAVNVTGVDRIRLGLTDSTPNDQEVFNLDIRYQGWRSGTGVNWQHLFGSRAVGLAGITSSVARVRQTVKDLVRDGVPPPGTPASEVIASSPFVYRADSIESETTLKYDATVTASANTKVQFGGNLKQFRVRYDSTAPLGFDSAYSLRPGVDPFSIDDRFTAWQSGAYAQVTHDLTSALNVTAGARFDRYQYIGASRFSPRLAATLNVTRRFAIKGSTGIYYQQPAFQFLTVFPQNRALKPFRANHYVGGVTYTLADGLVLSVEAYRKNYRDYPVSSEYPSLSLANLGDTFNVLESVFPLRSAGFGHSQGLELNLTKKDDGRWYGQANVSVSQAEHAALDGVLHPGSFDYPIVFNLSGGRRWSSKWESSLRVSFLSGRPYTPFEVEESTRQRRGIYDLSQVNAIRGPAYFRIDARMDRNATIAGKPVIVFVGIQNVTGRRNVNGFEWNRRSNVAEPLEQLGVFPSVGLEWRF
jgi:outer membrane receptor protein involved in Fe transport